MVTLKKEAAMKLSEGCRALAVAAGDAAAAIWFGVYAPFALAGSRIGEYFSKRRRRKA